MPAPADSDDTPVVEHDANGRRTSGRTHSKIERTAPPPASAGRARSTGRRSGAAGLPSITGVARGDRSSGLAPVTLGSFVRARRVLVGLTQRQLAEAVPVYFSYIRQIERNVGKHPSRDVIAGLASALRLPEWERRYLFELAQFCPVVDLPGPASLAAQLTTARLEELWRIEPGAAAYLDVSWNVLACNDYHEFTFPGMADAGNVLVWLFGTDAAKQVLAQWRREAALHVASFRTMLGRYRSAPAARELLQRLARYPEFVCMWHDVDDVVYGRGPDDDVMLLAARSTGSPVLRVSQRPIGPEPIQMFVAEATDDDVAAAHPLWVAAR